MRDLYNVFSGDKTMTAAQRLVQLDTTVTWFLDTPKNGVGLTDEVAYSLRTTTSSLRRLVEWQEQPSNRLWPSHTAHTVFSFLSTNVVENFFSIVRAKFRYPSLLMYATAYRAAYHYLVWRLAPDSGCPQFKAPIGMAYGNVEGIAFSFKSDVQNWSPSAKAAAIKEMHAVNTANISSDEEHERLVQTALEIASRLRPTRKLLTIREATCKKRPGRCHLVLCEAKGCPRMFTYAGAYATHKARCHPELMASAPAACIGDADADADADAAVAEENEDASNAITRDSAELDWAVVIVDVETTPVRLGSLRLLRAQRTECQSSTSS
jgi:hypothetical protein